MVNNMNSICDFCEHQVRRPHSDETDCGAAYYDSDKYGKHKRGSHCIHDIDLNNEFEPRNKDSSEVKNLSSQLKRQEDELMRLRSQVSVLTDRLTKVG